jgi:hypothetical protein
MKKLIKIEDLETPRGQIGLRLCATGTVWERTSTSWGKSIDLSIFGKIRSSGGFIAG